MGIFITLWNSSKVKNLLQLKIKNCRDKMAFKFFIYFFVVYVLFGEIFHQKFEYKYSFKEKEDDNSSFDCIINNVLIL